MSFADLHLKPEYTTGTDHFLRDFFVPVLKEARTYDRAVGYFSSSALVGLSKGLYGFAENGGKIRVLTSPHLSAEDFEYIRLGYEERQKIIERALLDALIPAKDLPMADQDRLSLLSRLIAHGILDIKIAFRSRGLYHEKIGILTDSDNRQIAFTGSANETSSALYDNYETISVFWDWRPGDKERVLIKRNHFDKIWNNQDAEIQVLPSETISNAIIEKYQRINYTRNLDNIELNELKDPPEVKIKGIPSDINLRPYQIEAVQKFLKANGRGIFDMATGTGKTFTALGALCALRYKCEENNQESIGVFIVAPMTYLVEQWASDIRKFGIEPIIAYSTSADRNWNSKLSTAIIRHQKQKQFFCIVTTNDTFANKNIQAKLKTLHQDRVNLFIIVDEAHNFGALKKRETLTDKFKYRLALSATLVRHNDKEGTDALLSYFGERCIEYSLEKAIKEKFLTPYEYHPIIITLTNEERLAYENISKKINSHCLENDEGKRVPDKIAEMLLIRRARLIATASEKIPALKAAIGQYRTESGLLVYCGTSGQIAETQEYISLDKNLENQTNEEKEFSQLSSVTKMLNSLEMKTAQYTSKISTDDRINLIEQFKNENIQVLTAIKCLDEGVSISSIKVAFILASTTNPKEYIQRRGRVLRLWKGKDKAIIYDFITLPEPLEQHNIHSQCFNSLAEKELKRFEEFNRLALNRDSNLLTYIQIADKYKITLDTNTSGI